MKSMTGFAKQRFAVGNNNVTIEIKTLNSKQLDLNVKLPALLRESDLPIRAALQRLDRGKVDVIVTLEESANTTASINSAILTQRLDDIRRYAESNGITYNAETMFNTIITQSAVWENASTSELSDDETAQLMAGVEAAIDEVERFRQEEGDVLRRDFDKHVAAIAERLEQIPAYEQERITTAKERICRYFEEFAINEMNKERFEQEMIYYLEKLDITEEKVRLRKHIDFFIATMDNEPICGKKLAFIAQEMGREINTTGSKANHVEIQRLVVEMKDELEKIKEQLGNIL